MSGIRTVVFPVAGRGTRFLPATKASPKEMLPIVDKPLIQYAVEEALEAGAERLVFITGSTKRAIEDHFDTDAELERQLAESGKHDLLALVREIVPPTATCIFVRQGMPLGLGHAVLCAQPVVGHEPFAVLLADDLIDARPGVRQKRIWEDKLNERHLLLARMAPGGSLPKHRHVGDELIFVIEGANADESGAVATGNMSYRPNGCVHTVTTTNGATVLAMLWGHIETM